MSDIAQYGALRRDAGTFKHDTLLKLKTKGHQLTNKKVPVAARSTAAHLLGLRVRIPPGACMSVCCERCVLSSRGLCDGLITRPDESCRLCNASFCVI
jgi:hypothetical protein